MNNRTIHWKFTNLIPLSEAAFILFYASSFFTITMLDVTWFGQLCRLVRFTSYGFLGLLGLYSITGWGSLKSMVRRLGWFIQSHGLFDLALLISVLAAWNARALEPLLIMLLFLNVRVIKIPRLLSLFFHTVGICFLMTVLLSLSPFLDNLVFVRGNEIRYALGFIYPLETHSAYLLISLAGLYTYRRQYPWQGPAVFAAGSILLFLWTHGRFSLILSLITALAFVFLNTTKHAALQSILQAGWFRVLLFVFVAALFITPNLLANYYQWGNDWFTALNELVNDRLVLGRKAFAYLPLQPFGARIEWIGYGGLSDPSLMGSLETYNYVDCSYIKNMFDYGWVYLIMEGAMYVYMTQQAARKNHPAFLICALCVLGLGLFEARLLQIAINPFLLGAYGLFLPSRQEGAWKTRLPKFRKPVARRGEDAS